MAGDLFPQSSPRIAPASQEAFAFVREHLQEREIAVFKLVARYLRETGYMSVTGGELSEWSGQAVTSLRPRLSGLYDAGWLTRARWTWPSRVSWEKRCHPYSLALPEAAIDRICSRSGG